jgi:hypothetical protein
MMKWSLIKQILINGYAKVRCDIIYSMKAEKNKKTGKLSIKVKKGALHKELGIKEGEKISDKELEKADKDAGPLEKKRITFAENAKKWKK